MGELGLLIFDSIFIVLVAVTFMSGVFVTANYRKRYDLVDVGWGSTIAAIAVASYVLRTDSLQFDARLLVTVIVLVWGVRLSFHILQRHLKSPTEDVRYQKMRQKWKGNAELNAFTRIYMVQAVLAIFVALPVVIVNFTFPPVPIAPLVAFGAAVWLFGFIFESISDRQLKEFISSPKNKGKLMKTGLWHYSRHPNYFGEITQWWGIGMIALSVPYGIIGLVGPLLITYLIVFVSGIPLIEKRYEGRSEWKEYKRTTSPLVPLPPKK